MGFRDWNTASREGQGLLIAPSGNWLPRGGNILTH